MSILQKLSNLKDYSGGKRHPTDVGLLWRRPRVWVGGELLNRVGYQPMRACYQSLTHRPSLSGLRNDLIEPARTLIDQGYLVIDNLLPADVFASVREEFQRGMDPGRNAVKMSTRQGVQSASGRFNSVDFPMTAEHLVNNQDMWSLVSAAVGRRLRYPPGAYFHNETMGAEALRDTDHNIVLHEDTYYPTFKAFFLINRNDPANGSFVYVAGSHRLDWKRLKHEYLYSIDSARQKKGRSVAFPVHENGRMEVFGPVYSKADLKEIQITAEANTLIIANTMGFHRRGGSARGLERQQVRMSFRCVETLHHRIHPHFGTRNSRRLRENDYY